MTDSDQPRPTNTAPSPDFWWDAVVFKVRDNLLQSVLLTRRKPQVDSTSFRVPRRAFTAASPLFETMFHLPSREEGNQVEGKSDGNPIMLEGYQAVDFDALLRVLYPS